MNKIPMQIYLDPETVEFLKDYAKREGKSFAEVVREAIAEKKQKTISHKEDIFVARDSNRIPDTSVYKLDLNGILYEVSMGKKSYEISEFKGKKALIIPLKAAKKEKIDWASHPARGMWKDREDMKDPVKWVNDLRKKNSMRSYANIDE